METDSRSVAYLLEDVMEQKFDYGFYQEELWAYLSLHDIPIVAYNMEDVKHWVYAPCWSYMRGGEECFLSIYQVLLQSEQFPEHMARIENANLRYPLVVIEDEFDKYGVILDGNHRFAKAVILGKKSVNIQVIEKDELIKHLYRKID